MGDQSNNSVLTTKSLSFHAQSSTYAGEVTLICPSITLMPIFYMVECPFQYPAHKTQDGDGMIIIAKIVIISCHRHHYNCYNQNKFIQRKVGHRPMTT